MEWLIRPTVSRYYNETNFNCANKQAGDNFDNLKLLIVTETKSALYICILLMLLLRRIMLVG